MNDNDNNDKRTTEIKGGKITPFAGKRETLEKFLETIGLHLILNRIKDNEDKIAFTLTYLEGGNADSWRAAFLKRSLTAGGEPNFRKWTDFLWELRNSFKLYDKEGDALDKIIQMRQGSTSIEDHVAKFKVLLADSGVTEDSPAALDYFQKSIRVPSLRRFWIRTMYRRRYPSGTKRHWRLTMITTRSNESSKGTDQRKKKEDRDGTSERKRTITQWMSTFSLKSTRPWQTKRGLSSWRKAYASDAKRGGISAEIAPRKKEKPRSHNQRPQLLLQPLPSLRKWRPKNLQLTFEALRPCWMTTKRRSSMTRPSGRVFDMENRVDVGLS